MSKDCLPYNLFVFVCTCYPAVCLEIRQLKFSKCVFLGDREHRMSDLWLSAAGCLASELVGAGDVAGVVP